MRHASITEIDCRMGAVWASPKNVQDVFRSLVKLVEDLLVEEFTHILHAGQ